MNYTKEELESLINNSALFSIDKEKDIELYKTERYKVVNLLTEYYRCYIYSNKDLSEYDLELIETFNSCISSYNFSNGLFLNYFNKSMKNKMIVTIAKNAESQVRCGMSISANDGIKISKMINYCKSNNMDLLDEDVQSKIAIFLDTTIDDVKELILMNINTNVKGGMVKDEDDEYVDVFSFVASKEPTPEEICSQEFLLIEKAKAINTAFNSLQNRPYSNRLISMILTEKFIEGLDGDIELFYKITDGCNFINKDVLKHFINTSNYLTIRKISEVCGVLEQSANRTINKFLEKIKL